MMNEISWREATIDDSMLYFEWANDPFVRSQAINKSEIALKEHENWFAQRIKSADTVMYVFEVNDKPFGQVRFDLKDGNAMISYSIAEQFRGKGLGRKMLMKAIKVLKEKHGNHIFTVAGFVKKKNIPSTRIFEKIGFEHLPDEKISDELYHSFILKLSVVSFK